MDIGRPIDAQYQIGDRDSKYLESRVDLPQIYQQKPDIRQKPLPWLSRSDWSIGL